MAIFILIVKTRLSLKTYPIEPSIFILHSNYIVLIQFLSLLMAYWYIQAKLSRTAIYMAVYESIGPKCVAISCK